MRILMHLYDPDLKFQNMRGILQRHLSLLKFPLPFPQQKRHPAISTYPNTNIFLIVQIAPFSTCWLLRCVISIAVLGKLLVTWISIGLKCTARSTRQTATVVFLVVGGVFWKLFTKFVVACEIIDLHAFRILNTIVYVLKNC